MTVGPGAPARPAPLSSYRTPGVRVEWLDAAPQQLVLARTDITGFVGVAERGPLHQPVLVESFEQYIGVFGTGRVQGNLPYAVEGFFANGGTRCWVVRAADPAQARFAFLDLPFTTGPDTGGRLHLSATSPGTWGNRIRVTIQPDPLHHGRFTLVLRMGAVLEVWRDAGVDPDGRRFVVSLLGGEGSTTGSRLVTVAWTPGPWRSGRPRTKKHPGTTELGLAGGADGLTTLTPRHLAGSHPPSQDPWGVAALDAIDEIGIVCVPDCWTTRRPASTTPTPPPRDCARPEAPAARADLPADRAPERLDLSEGQAASLQHDVVAHCEARGDRVALLDGPPGTVPRALEWRAGAPSSAYAAAYYPWLRVVDPDSTTGAVVEVPPSGHVAGICGRVDASPGVHKPPAGEVVELGVDTATPLDDLEHGDLNEAGVNALRAGRTVQVMGARTLSRDSQWMYLNVRRLAIMIERTVERAAAWTVFEPDSERLQAEITRVVTGVVEEVWRRGMLNGATREQAYRVVCNASNNPVEDVLAGRLVCLVYLNPPPPAEFVVLRIVREPTAVTAAGGGGGDG